MFVIQIPFLALPHKVLFNMDKSKAIQSVNEIKELMERSSKFVSLSGLTGVLVGIFALTGAWIVNRAGWHNVQSTIVVAAAVLLLSMITAISVFLWKIRKTNERFLSRLTLRTIWHFSLPLLVGGLFCLILLHHKHYELITSAMLLFYGFSWVSVSKYTFAGVAWLGYAFLLLGLLDALFAGNELLFWSLGFGVFHIIYGVLFYFAYEKNK